MYCTVVTTSRSSGISNGLTYQCQDLDVQIGQLVLVPLRNRQVEGIVVSVSESLNKGIADVKNVTKILWNTPVLSKEQIETMKWMATYYYCSLRQALRVFLPAEPWRLLLPEITVLYRLSQKDAQVRGAKQQAVCDVLQGQDRVEKQRLLEESGASMATVSTLLKRGVLEEVKQQQDLTPLQDNNQNYASVSLTTQQQTVHMQITTDAKPALLFGVTGSGKTEVYAQLMLDAFTQGKQALLLVPEILLTEHCIDRFVHLLGSKEKVAVLHSRLTPAGKRNIWKRIHAGQIQLVIGSRSAVFAPLRNLGLVVIDEEHEWTYKNEQTPRYHTRRLAEQLCRQTDAKLILGSATPSLESWQNAKNGTYLLTRLPERYNNQSLPDVQVIDLADVHFGNYYPFSPTLLSAIKDQLQKKEQSVLFLNRRGAATALLCFECRRRLISPDSQLPFTVHHRPDGTPYLMDHTTGVMGSIPDRCPHCQSTNMQEIGAGTQRIEQILHSRFPQARLLRMDADTMKKPDQMKQYLQAMRSHEADILLGTQSVVKGLDLPEVTLAAVLVADVGLSLPDFRAGERVFQLLTQLTGRSGRAKPGRVIIQSFRPESPEVQFAARHDTETYMEQEHKLRTHALYPPATSIIRLLMREGDAKTKAKQIAHTLRNADCQVSFGPTLFGGGREWQVLVRGVDPKSVLKNIPLEGIIVDVDPVECV